MVCAPSVGHDRGVVQVVSAAGDGLGACYEAHPGRSCGRVRHEPKEAVVAKTPTSSSRRPSSSTITSTWQRPRIPITRARRGQLLRVRCDQAGRHYSKAAGCGTHQDSPVDFNGSGRRRPGSTFPISALSLFASTQRPAKRSGCTTSSPRVGIAVFVADARSTIGDERRRHHQSRPGKGEEGTGRK